MPVRRIATLSLVGVAVFAAAGAIWFTLLQPAQGGPNTARTGAPAPQVALPVVGGGASDLAADRGKVVVLNFWATWCEPCKSEMPALQQLADELRDRPFRLYSVDLQEDGPSNEAGIVTAAGMKFFRIGMTTSKAPTDAQIAQFFEIVNNPANQPVYVHCAGGRHRTGTMTALYRMTFDGWNASQAYNEMKQYRFEGFPDHPVLRNYVYAYHPALPKQPAVLATSIVTTK